MLSLPVRKQDEGGTAVQVGIQPSKVELTKLKLDKDRTALLDRGSARQEERSPPPPPPPPPPPTGGNEGGAQGAAAAAGAEWDELVVVEVDGDDGDSDIEMEE
ncbi:hypothetical protein JKP88DRAFT_354681 [Tribonema minus]|uniref:Uncharacterized protein n=1 Tax=Tribonema minus TaxID=303371 RepID=A0A836CDD2_9STRA|nr:hypothetical protein JKP88DRAFT_354681 [Tribonema minus]